jgi:hypothetical protein
MPSALQSAQLQHPSQASTSGQSIYGASPQPCRHPSPPASAFSRNTPLSSQPPPILAKTG